MTNNRYETYLSIASNLRNQAHQLEQKAEQFEFLACKYDTRPKKPLSKMEQMIMDDILSLVIRSTAHKEPAAAPIAEGADITPAG
jgi:hypothetical protein